MNKANLKDFFRTGKVETEPPTQEPAPSKPRRLDFADLRPASSLIAANPTAEPAPVPELDADEQRIEKARAMPITILGHTAVSGGTSKRKPARIFPRTPSTWC